MSGSFRGWYFRYQSPRGHALALIPALHTDTAGRGSASLQVITEDRAWWLEYPAEAYAERRSPFQVRLGENIFDSRGCFLDVDHPELTLRGAVHHGPISPLPTDIMGSFRFVPKMACIHSVVSMGHSLQGRLTLGGHQMDFSGGRGYIEGDRGHTFPRSYLWTQCLWETPATASLMLSVATVPLGPIGFTGCICAIHYEGQEYRLATYRGARVEYWSKAGAVIRQGRFLLTVQLVEERPQPLRAPILGEMRRTVHESLCARVRFCLTCDREVIFDHTDSRAGFEFDAGAPEP